MSIRWQTAMLLSLAFLTPVVSEQAAAQGLLGPLEGAEIEQGYDTGASAPSAPASRSTKKARKDRQARGKARETAPAVKPSEAVDADETLLETDQATGTITPPALKAKALPKPAPRVRAAFVAPLPPPRPWGDESAPGDVADAPRQAEPSAPVAAAPAAPTTPDIAMNAPDQRSVTPEARSAKKSLVLIVKSDLRGVADLTDRRIATGFSGEPPKQFQEMVERGAGLRVAAVDMSWSAGLESLAKGEVDGITLSIGPPLAPEEIRGLAMDKYQVLEIPLDREASSNDRK